MGEILDFSASINPLGPPLSAIHSLQAALHQIHAYPDPQYQHLGHALARFHGIDPEWVLPGNGAAELLTWAARDLAAQETETGRPTWVLAPGFRDYGRALAAFGGTARSLPVTPGLSTGQPWSTPYQSLPLPPEPGAFLVNTPHNPTGLLFACDSLRSRLEQGGLVVVDEAFLDFLPEGDRHSCIPWLEQFPTLIVIRSLTKFYSVPGLRLGYAVAHPDRLRRWQQWRDPWSVNSLAAAAGVTLLQDRDFQTKTWAWLPPCRDRLYRALDQIPGLTPYPSAANFLLVRCDRPVPELQAQLLQQHRILIRDCLSFPELGDRFFRVAVRTDADNRRLTLALAAQL